MHVAIYARTSPRDTLRRSLDEQIEICKKHLKENNHTCLKNHIFTDILKEESTTFCRGAQSLEKAIKRREVEGVVVDDLLRLPKRIVQEIFLINAYNYCFKVKIFSTFSGYLKEINVFQLTEKSRLMEMRDTF